MKKLTGDLRGDLAARARSLLAQGYSVIPVYGNSMPAEPKKAAVRWRPFQKRLASAAEVTQFFASDVSALGVVCGQLSRLLVIDFDDHLRYRRFSRHLPQYEGSYTVKTRRGYHVYFRTGVKVPSHQFSGGDIKAEKSYVVGAGSIIGDFKYQCVKDAAVMQLEKSDLERIFSYFHVKTADHVVPGLSVRRTREIDIEKTYRNLAPIEGRNNALFRAASLSRDAGRSEADTCAMLLELHAGMEGKAAHRNETFRERWLEGERTIKSAYRGAGERSARGAVPNSVREFLLRNQRSTLLARLLDAFALAGWQAEAHFTLKEACSLGSEYGLNRKSVMRVLTGEGAIFNGRHIISRRYVEYLDFGGLKCKGRGRPVLLSFQVPSVGRLLEVLGVAVSPSDVIDAEDIRSAFRYRLAVHREYVSRVDGATNMATLASRIGVCTRTLSRYNRALGAQVEVVVGRLKLGWRNLWCLPARGRGARKNATNGYWLELRDGARFPAWRHIGMRLLRAGVGEVRLCLRKGSIINLPGKGKRESLLSDLDLLEFTRVRALRDGDAPGNRLTRGLAGLVDSVKRRRVASRYRRTALFFESVLQRIADDKIAESIGAYLVAHDVDGAEVRRPARRGIAFRMLKEFGNGRVFLALREAAEAVAGSGGVWSSAVGSTQSGMASAPEAAGA